MDVDNPARASYDAAMRTEVVLALAAMLLLACSESRSPDNLSVHLFLDQDSASVRDTLSGTIRIRNGTLKRVTVRSPHLAEGELYFYDELGNIDLRWPAAAPQVVHEWRLEPLCHRDYVFRLLPSQSWQAGTYRVHAHPAGHLTPYDEKILVLTD